MEGKQMIVATVKLELDRKGSLQATMSRKNDVLQAMLYNQTAKLLVRFGKKGVSNEALAESAKKSIKEILDKIHPEK